MAKPSGLIARGSSWGIRVRVPDRLRAHIGRKEIWKSFGQVGYQDACRLARIERVAIDRRFLEAEAEWRMGPAAPLTDDELYHLTRAFLHKMEVDAGPVPVLREDREAELEANDETAGYVGQSSVEDATLQRVAKSFADWAGRKVQEGSEDFFRICEGVQEAWLEHLNRRSVRLRGRAVSTLDPLFAGVDASQPLSAPLTVSAAVKAYKEDPERSSVARKTRAAWEFRLRAVEQLLGPDRLIGSITREDIRECRDKLMRMPKNASKHFPGLAIADATTLAEKSGMPRLSAKSVSLYIDQIVALFNWLEREEIVHRNPAKGLKGPSLPREKPRRPLTLAEIDALLVATRHSESETKPWTYWLIRVALMNGMRLSEIAGLAVSDVEQVDGVWTFRVRPNPHRDLKTSASTRDIPIHPNLVELGLPGLARDRPMDALLFEGVPQTNGSSNAPQKRIGRLVRSVIRDQRATFHSLRHNFRDGLRDAGVPSDVAARLGGWAHNGSEAMEGYGRGHRMETLLAWISRVSYPNTNLE